MELHHWVHIFFSTFLARIKYFEEFKFLPETVEFRHRYGQSPFHQLSSYSKSFKCILSDFGLIFASFEYFVICITRDNGVQYLNNKFDIISIIVIDICL